MSSYTCLKMPINDQHIPIILQCMMLLLLVNVFQKHFLCGKQQFFLIVEVQLSLESKKCQHKQEAMD